MIPVNEPYIGEKEFEYVNDCLKSGWISSSGKYITEFEEKWASYCGRKYGVAVCNGTVALEAAVKCLDLSPGDEVIMPSFTIISCALAVIENGCKPVLVDSDPDTWCMDVNQIEEKITSKTRAIMPVHIYGHPVDMDPLLSLAQKYNLFVIEDAAEAHGAEYKGKKCGSFGDMSCFSFYANKIITTGEGGMVLTDDEHLVNKLRSERNLAFRPEKRFYHTEFGHNYRLTNLQAAVGVAQIERIEEHIEKKRWIANCYYENLKGIEKLNLPVEKKWARNVYWMYGIVLKGSAGMNAKEMASILYEKGIETRPFFLGMHRQPILWNSLNIKSDDFKFTDYLGYYGLYLPSGLTISKESIDFISKKIVECLF